MKRMKLTNLVISLLVFSLAACSSGAPQAPGYLLAPTQPAASPYPPTPTSGAPSAASSLPNQSINLINAYAWDAYIFLDQVYLLTLPPQRAAIYSGIQPGRHALQACRQQDLENCEPPLEFDIPGTMSFTFAPGITSPSLGAAQTAAPAQPEPTLTPSQTPMPPSTTPSLNPIGETAVPNFALTAAPGAARFIVTIHNNYPYSIMVSMDGKHLLSIPAKHYMWHVGILAGWHTFTFKLIGGAKISQREIYIGKDTELWVSP